MLSIEKIEAKCRSIEEEFRKNGEDRAKNLMKRYKAKIAFYYALAGADLGILIEEPSDWNLTDVAYGYTVEVPKEKLAAIRGILDSQFELAGKRVKDVASKTIWVDLYVKKFPGCKLRYETVLKDTDQCEIQTVTSPAYSSEQLVCKVLPKP